MLSNKFIHSISFVNGKVYCISGDSIDQTTEIFDVDKNEWSLGPKNFFKKYGYT